MEGLCFSCGKKKNEWYLLNCLGRSAQKPLSPPQVYQRGLSPRDHCLHGSSAFHQNTQRGGHMRHDVLLICSDETQAEIEESRTLFLRNTFANHTHFTMRKPHVTHGSFEERGEAERVAQELNTQFLPHGVVVTGVTID